MSSLKKLPTAFAAIFVCALSFINIHAQTGKPSPPIDGGVVSKEAKVKTFLISSFLFELRGLTDDADEYDDFLTSDNIFRQTIDDFSAVNPDFKRLADAPPATAAERAARVDEVISAFKRKLNSSDLWQFELGKAFAGAMVEMLEASSASSDMVGKYDENALKRNLSKIKELCAAAPSDFPREVRVKLEDLANTNPGKRAMSDKDFRNIASRTMALFEAIAPGSTK